MKFDIFSPLSPQYSTPPRKTFGTFDFSSMFSTPQVSLMNAMNDVSGEGNNDRREYPRRQRWAPKRFTPRTTPSNH
ncbi:hypothetical protein GOBAR_AA30656 [Gossypium barbadense]|uniref:Uncharacterized protein n=1 Tax=Gossypium barbadense TaxID=3634 RepID=A0A2P5WG10_GOSBA|nr:hypothetical protein GOBAR_AA30656 [Gossypium barbadense]